jgi:alkylation response protein AidB-like acyl-CoA dehydrogenase
MDFTFSEADEAFRVEVKDWLSDHLVGDFRTLGPGGGKGDDPSLMDLRKAWERELSSGGWVGLGWPKEYGGRELPLTQEMIFNEEYARAEAPARLAFFGEGLLGPTIMAFGTEQQKQRFLPPILKSEEFWCQGFSEPDAGSDLANVKTTAVLDGDEWVINGQKVWTSLGHIADWIFVVCRTDPDAPKKHQGLTYFLMDMEQPGVQVVPLRQITGEAEFNELFIDGARVPEENVLGGVGNGWKVALTTLMNERAGLAFFLQVRLRQLLDALIAEVGERGLLEDPVVADKLGELHLKAEILRLTAYRGLTAIETYGQPGPEGSLTKWMWSDTNQQLTQFAADLLGPDALRAGDRWAYELLRARGNTIEGGTTEVLKNIVAERVLGLPRMR